MKKIIPILLILQFHFFAQSANIIRDTSYTAFSTYKKEVEKFPFIKIVQPVLPNNVNAIRNIEYISYGERKLNLDLFFTNSNCEIKPAVILVHGGGWKTGDKSLTFPLALQLANKGYVAVSIEYRLSSEALFPAAIIDVKNSIKWLKKNATQYYVDTNKIALLGCSAGGQIASLAGFSRDVKEFEDYLTYPGYSSEVSVIINIDGLLDFLGNGSEEFDEVPDPKNPRVAHKWLGTSHIENPELWAKASPINYLNEKSIPILFINSSRPRFHAGRDEAILKFEKFDIYYEVHLLQNSPHSFWLFHPWFIQTTSIVSSFLYKIFSN